MRDAGNAIHPFSKAKPIQPWSENDSSLGLNWAGFASRSAFEPIYFLPGRELYWILQTGIHDAFEPDHPAEISSLPTAEVPEHCHSAGVAAENVWRDGMMFVIAPDSVLPARCLKCNAESGGLPSSKKISTLRHLVSPVFFRGLELR